MINQTQVSPRKIIHELIYEWKQDKTILVAVVLLSALIQVSKMLSSDMMTHFGYACLFGVFVFCLRDFNKLIVLLPFSFFTMGQAPPAFGIGEYYFSILVVTIFINLFFIEKKEFFHLKDGEKLYFSFLTTFLLINFIVALNKGATPYDWLRAILPFFICLLYKPLHYFLTHAEESYKKNFFIALLALFVLFSLQVVVYYIYFDLYHHHYHVYDPTLKKMLIISQDQVGNYNAEDVLYYLTRVTAILDEATNPLIILGSVLGQIIFIWAKEKKEEYLGLLLIGISTVGFVLTNTRTLFMVFFIVYGFNLLGLFCFYKSKIKKGIKASAFALSCIIGSIFLCKMDDAILYRFQKYFVENKRVEIKKDEIQKDEIKTVIQDIKEAKKDSAILMRSQEYKIAYDFFKTSPIVGVGQGVKHPIPFVVGTTGKTGKQRVVVEKQVSYIHNWFFYMIMSGGIFGLCLYLTLIINLFWVSFKLQDERLKMFIRSGLLTLFLYGSFFAVFKLATFNFILALFLAVTYNYATKKNYLVES